MMTPEVEYGIGTKLWMKLMNNEVDWMEYEFNCCLGLQLNQLLGRW